MERNNKRTGKMVKMAILAAIAFVLMMFEIPLPFAPSFFKLGFDEVAILLAGFSMGPLAGIIVEFLKIALNIAFQGTDTAFVGELSNFIVGICLVVPSAIYYQKHRTKNGAYIGMCIGTLCMMVGGALCNYFIALPAYSYFYHLPMNVLIQMGTVILPAVHDKLTFVIFMTLPFNFVKGAAVCLIVALIYKRISPILHS